MGKNRLAIWIVDDFYNTGIRTCANTQTHTYARALTRKHMHTHVRKHAITLTCTQSNATKKKL